ncbi:MAG: SDR family NAD(P)-dependent oxidoreductase, partial [Pseudomonadota bacterium]
MNILVTGAAGFIGFHLCKRLLADGHSVTGLDSLNDYYSVDLKRDRLKRLTGEEQFTFAQLHLEDHNALKALYASAHFDAVVNLAAQAGVRYSIENPHAYIDSNVNGFI